MRAERAGRQGGGAEGEFTTQPFTCCLSNQIGVNTAVNNTDISYLSS